MFKARCHPLKKWLIIGVYSPPTHQSSSIIISCICQKISVDARSSPKNPVEMMAQQHPSWGKRIQSAPEPWGPELQGRGCHICPRKMMDFHDGWDFYIKNWDFHQQKPSKFIKKRCSVVNRESLVWFFRRLRSSVEKTANFSCHLLIGPKVFNY